ncbi:PAS domain S-box protein [Caballeronia sp. ATUFL_M2_KS44]|uniref:PAS domain-containing hybrid sensor histidine kinase/response regulator n=1 Tax=Caballeronia sp. ATUFL_M2_KS44 TaxID=2921767 RepID=UPI002028B0C5|nr:PAS domain S-box protein [Caballeronia sp. ATUFL_M2_KS44]
MSVRSIPSPFALEPDFRLLFEATPVPYLILTPDFIMVAANEARLRATMSTRAQILGKNVFEVFPDNPDDPTATGVRNLRASLSRVLRNKVPDAMAVQRYDIPVRDSAEEEFEVRYWSPLNTPILDSSGEVVYIIHQVEDVTERVLKQQAIEESEARFREIANAMPQMVWSTSPEGDHYYYNKQYFDFTGVSPDSTTGERWGNVLHPDDQERASQEWGKSLSTGDPYQIEYRVRHRSGEYRWVLARALPIRDESGHVLRWIGSSTDVHEQRLAEEARVKSESKFRKIVESDIIGIYEFDSIGRITAVNEKFLHMLGYTRDEFDQHGLSWRSLTPAEWEKPDACALEELESKGRTRPFEKEYFRKDGARLPVYIGAATLGNTDAEAIAYVLDISELKKAQSDVRESEIRFRALAENIPQLAWMANSDGSIFWFNNRWFQYTGTTLEEMQGWGWRRVHHPDYVEAVTAKYYNSIVVGKLTWEDTFPLRSADGRYRWFLSRAVPIRDEHGNVVRWFGSNTDVTDQRQAEEALQQENRRKDEFLAMLAHELRNPLAPISTAAQLLVLGDRNEHDVRRSSDIIFRQVKHLTELVDDLLDVSRVTRGLATIDKEEVSIKEIINSAIEQARPLIEARQHDLTIQLTSTNAVVLGDRTRLIQVVANLLNNAAKYTPRGGKIELVMKMTGSLVCIDVIDNGTGIDAKLLPHVFELFTQAERTPDRIQGGLGLGLALVKSIMDLHGGTVTAKSDGLGKGSVFLVTLPILETNRLIAERPLASVEDHATINPLRILIVDDNEDGAESLATLLRLGGHDVATRHTALAGLEEASSFLPQVFILDIGLPDMDGYELARRLHLDSKNDHALFVALSGYGQAHDKVLAKGAGFDHYFIKPIDIGALQKALALVDSR